VYKSIIALNPNLLEKGCTKTQPFEKRLHQKIQNRLKSYGRSNVSIRFWFNLLQKVGFWFYLFSKGRVLVLPFLKR